MSRFDTYLQAVLERAEVEARQDSSSTIEAQHLLLAMATQEDTGAQRALASVGLDHQTITDMLRRELEHSLSAAGVSLDTFDLPRASQDPTRRPRIGTSAKLALERMAMVHRKKDLRSGHLLVGILQAEVGTVPRALATAGVDRSDLIQRARSEL